MRIFEHWQNKTQTTQTTQTRQNANNAKPCAGNQKPKPKRQRRQNPNAKQNPNQSVGKIARMLARQDKNK